MIHLICGPIGAGKTTVAHKIAKEKNAIRFSEDEWLAKLFVPDAPKVLLAEPIAIVSAWAAEKYARCRGQIWLVCKQLLDQNVSIVLDGAAANKAQRDAIRRKASENQVEFQLYYVNADPEVRKNRVFSRNLEKGTTYSLEVTQEIFDHTESIFQDPQGEELRNAILIET